ncbi:cytochrome c-type biogenesis protein CcmH [Rubricella aquisinus]|uniref:Cytochrome c-type biogenesis protein n=1 Tax=Rubricella aquisinus TaxID=2028108 RepID=A0A840WMH4_9RHOB|nr:cytochrome c-type biogenesis protein [Rubricella aquisinus]MBB5514862.1 cytochrome c-type biogenesis protein CcmH [Rubricella aquisinus]
MRALLIALMLWATPSMAVQPDEVLDDPVLEQRAREISEGLRCLVCRNENIDLSNAELARDLRIVVRERLVAGDTDEEVLDFMVARYGEFVLLQPRFHAGNAALWLAGPALLLLGGGIAIAFIRRRRPESASDTLTEAERARLDALLKENDDV